MPWSLMEEHSPDFEIVVKLLLLTSSLHIECRWNKASPQMSSGISASLEFHNMSSSESYSQQRIAYAKKVSQYVVKVLDEFGKQKWGMAGWLLKGRTYKIYAKDHNTGHLPEWMIVHNFGKLSNKATEYWKPYKYPYYRLTLDVNDKVLSGTGEPRFVIYYGGYDVEDVYTATIMTEVSEASLKEGLDEILSNSYEPSPIYSHELDPKEWGQSVKRIL